MRKNIGADIAYKAYGEYLASLPAKEAKKIDQNAQLFSDTLSALVDSGQLKLPVSGYTVKRRRGKSVTEKGSVAVGAVKD